MTSFQTIPIKGRDNKPVPFKNPIEYPQCKNSAELPNNFYTCLVVGSTGTGKSFSVAKLLKYYEQEKIYNKKGEEVPQMIHIFAPSIESNPIWTALKNLDPEDCHTNYTDAKLQQVLDRIKDIKDEAEEYQEQLKLYKKFLKTRSLKYLTPRELLTLDSNNFEPPVKPEYPINPVHFIILDDLINGTAFKATGKSLINSLAIRNRHLGINLFILAQSAPQIPKTIRSQARLLMLYRYNSKNIIDDLYEIVSSVITPDEFEKMYMEATEHKYEFLTIDNTGKDICFKKNLEAIIVLNKQNKKPKDK